MITAHVLMIGATAIAIGAAVGMMRYLRGTAAVPVLDTGFAVLELNGSEDIPPPFTSSRAAGACREGEALYERSAARLMREIHALSRRGNLNLTIGVITTGFAVGLLAYMVMNEDAPTGDTAEVLAHYIPRISTVSFIEVFSYFFLRLYRASLAEIKFYQNELTALASQQIALDASRSVDPAALRATLDQIARHNPNAVPSSSLQPTAYSLDSDPRLKLALELVDRVTTLAVVGAKARSAV